jgi:hypothetical protein
MATTAAQPDPGEGGFEPEEPTYRLRFEDPDMAGLVVMIGQPSIGQMLAMSGMEIGDSKNMDPEKIRAVFSTFADLLDSWNVTRKGVPVPATLEGVLSQSPGFITRIIAALDKTIAPDPTSSPASASGGTSSPEISIPMTPVQPSPPGS